MKKQLGIWMLLGPLSLFAQESITVEAFFLKALENADTTSISPEKRIRMPWVESYDLRMRTDDFIVNENLYTFRIAPSTPKKRKAQQALSEHIRLAPDFEQEEAFCELLATTYGDWLDLYVLEEKENILAGLDSIFRDKRRLFERMAAANDFDLKEWLKLQTDETDLAIAQEELRAEQERLRLTYGLGTEKLDFSTFITLQKLQNRLQVGTENTQRPQDLETQYEQERVAKELELEVAESRQIVDFAQLRYQGPQTDLLRERLSVGIGFRIPNSGNRRIKIQELELEQKELAREAYRDADRLNKILFDGRQELLFDIRAFTHYKQTIDEEREQLRQLSTLIMEKEGTDPLLLLEIEERHLKTLMKACERWEDILEQYLKYEERAGRLCRQRDRNLLGGD